jgi:hypothetical protein
MAKLIKGDIVQNIITDGDVIVTSPSKIGKTLDEVLVEQQSDIDKLKSNVKYIYAYGGVGGSGSGSGSGSGDKPISVLITLNGVAVNNGNGAIILDGKGKYKLYIKISNAGGKKLFMGYTTNGSTVTDDLMFYTLNGDNKYKREIDIDLNGNGILNIGISDDEGNNLGYYTQEYIVDSDVFNVSLNYIDINGEIKQYNSEPYECFVSDPNRKNRYFKIDHSIFLPEYSEVNIKCEIDGVGVIYDSFENNETPSGNIEIPIEGENCEVFINGEPILKNEHMGTYTLKATLSYKITGKEVVRTRSFLFSVVPSGLYINVRTAGDVLYDELDLLKEDIKNGVDGIPYKCISQGSSLMLYCKVFEGVMSSNPSVYEATFNTYDAVIENGEIVDWNVLNISETESLVEQIESTKGVSVTFPSGGIKRIKISTKGTKGSDSNIVKEFYKYVFVKPFESNCEWFDKSRYNAIIDSYFKANQGSDTYNLFPSLSSGDGVLSLTTSSNQIILSKPEWSNITDHVCTVITFGIQVSNINSENAKIVDVYTVTSASEPEYPLRTTRLFTDINSEINKIAIPTEVLNKNENNQYHLIQIIRNLSDTSDGPVFEDCLYIDGLLESANRETRKVASVVTKLVLNNINICYNLINIQYFTPTYKVNDVTIKFNPDGYAYQYWLSYKEKYVNSGYEGERLKEEEIFLKDNMYRISFDGTNVVVDESIVRDIASRSDLPTVVFSYNCENGAEKKVKDFMELMWKGRSNGDTSFNSRKIDLYWIPERQGGNMNEYLVNIPNNFTDNTNGYNISGEWEIDLQGTSTMRNGIKNYSLRIRSNAEKEKILFSPKFDINNNRTFLPDIEWTIKADIADSAHANNTSIGKFVNDVCTKIDTNISDAPERAKKFIKNTLEGIPVLLYFMCTGKDDDGVSDITKIYYFGIYNFNLGRNSYYNLGYTGGIVDEQEKRSDFMRVFYNIEENVSSKYYKDKVFTFAVGEGTLSPNIAIGEIQDNYPEYDFHQFDETLLFKKTDNSNACMFGAESKITAANIADAQKALKLLVTNVAKAGKFCFEKADRKNDFVPSRDYSIDGSGNTVWGKNCINRYEEGKIPDPKWQKRYRDTLDEFGSNVEWFQDTTCDNVSDEDLKRLITTFEDESGIPNKPILNYTSAAEYYTICMAFGMVDSVLKNMNLKNFRSMEEGPNFYCAFYDMDCALEEANDGEEKISYLAATDYWYSPTNPNNPNKIGEILKKNDYWDSVNGGKGFDFTSSYLFSVVKYAKPIFESYTSGEQKYESDLIHYPQNFWAVMRNSDGMLRSADYFIENYFKSGITTTFEYLASLNYRVKYLYHGKAFNSNDEEIDQYLANGAAFNGSRKIKVKNWLSKRLRFMDVMMNVNNLQVPICNGLILPGPGEEYKDKLSSNNDITILHSAFDSSQFNTALSGFTGEVAIYAPKHTPFIFASGSDLAQMYLLPGGVDKPNLISFVIQESVGTRFYGSGLFTSVDKIESMFTNYRSIISDNIEKITYGGSNVSANSGDFNIDAKSATEINLNIPNMGGTLKISDKCISLLKINISNSKFSGRFQNFPNLQEVNVSGIDSKEIYVSGSKFLTGEKFYISGKDKDHRTKLDVLDISGVTGNFNCIYTNIEDIRITNSVKTDDPDFNSNMLSEFSISGDKRLRSLSLNGFRKVYIDNCTNLENLKIDDSLEELYINLRKVDKDEITSSLKKISFGTDGEDGVFDLTGYINLKKVTLINCDNLVHLKLPNNNIETDGINNNANLKWIDTGILPAFRDDKKYNGVGIYEGKVFETYKNSPKLILCSDSAFSDCPNYAMLRSDWDKGVEMTGDSNLQYYKAYTNITVSNKCSSLAKSFYVGSSISGDKFDMDTAIRFIEICVPDEVKLNITSLSDCFKGRKGIEYSINEASWERNSNINYHPRLDKYESVTNISGMYDKTGVKFISRNLLDLPSTKNYIGNNLNWEYFIDGMSRVNIASDALYNISYRLKSYSYISFTIYEYNGSEYILVGKDENNIFKICDFFYPFDDGKKIYNEQSGYTFGDDVERYVNITSIESLNFSDQYIDFRGMFELFPNVQILHTFLNGNLNKYNINGLLKPCKNIRSIIQSFCNSNINGSQEIDLYEFFNWEENTTSITNLFEGREVLINGFTIRKNITYENLKKVLKKIESYTNLTRLTNLFSYCIITEYNNEEIKFDSKLYNITNISNLFDNCTSDYRPLANFEAGVKGIYNGGVINIGRSFFEKLPNFTVAQRTLANTYLSSSLTYDYFCKRGNTFTEKNVLMSTDRSDIAKLYEYDYNSNIINLKECFESVKFVDCKNWFDSSDSEIIINRNYIKHGNNTYNERGCKYYKYDAMSGSYEMYILDNDIIDDCLDNYTDFVPQNEIQNSGSPITWYNHDLRQDFTYYNNIKEAVKPFDPVNSGCVNTIQKTYCCLPPDILYGCSGTADITGIFANSNIIGVIPRNLIKKVKTQSISNIFKNVNIMPNLEYYYDKDGSLNETILSEITEIVDIEGGIGTEYTVIFRDEYGKLKKRKPVSGDRNLGQFVYVPDNFTTSGSISNAFNFRYNLPRYWEMPSKNTVGVSSYKSTHDLNIAISTGELNPTVLSYHSQYYFLTNKSVKWDNIYDAKSVFISSNQDRDFSNSYTIGDVRLYYDQNNEIDINKKNTWTNDSKASTPSSWTNNVIENFYIDLNLCGKKNKYNMIENTGCPIVIKNKKIHLDNFVSGIITIFLNGRVFDEEFVVNDLTTSNHKSSGGSSVIGYYGLGKNIILPAFIGVPSDENITFIPIDDDIVYYDFMVDNDSTSISNYYEYFAKDKVDKNYLFENKYDKYIFK